MAASRHARNPFATAVILSLAWTACGGGAPEPATAERAGGAERSPSEAHEESASTAESEREEPAVAKRAACDDGTCTQCGDAQCPIGWYCDESAKGGPACGWL